MSCQKPGVFVVDNTHCDRRGGCVETDYWLGELPEACFALAPYLVPACDPRREVLRRLAPHFSGDDLDVLFQLAGDIARESRPKTAAPRPADIPGSAT